MIRKYRNSASITIVGAILRSISIVNRHLEIAAISQARGFQSNGPNDGQKLKEEIKEGGDIYNCGFY